MPEPRAVSRTAVILTALPVETRAVLRHLSQSSPETVSGTAFFRGEFEDWRVVLAEVGPGNASAAAITVRACEHYRPEVALFVGVAGGVKDVAIGDVVVATKVYGYESGNDQSAGLLVRPDLLVSAHALEQQARLMCQTNEWRTRLAPQIGHDEPTLFVGPIAAGEKIVASRRAPTAKLLRKHYGDTLGVEMEGRGFLEGVHIIHSVQGCVIRGISDLLSGKKSADQSGSQERAADAAAAVAFQMLAGLTVSTSSPSASGVRGVVEGVDASNLREVAAALLHAGTPPSITMLFPGASAAAREALESAAAIERFVMEANPSAGGSVRGPISALASTVQRRHLILGPPGSGKTHALWHTANRLLHAGNVIPLFLPAGQVNRWDELASMISEGTPTLSLDNILRDPRVCVMIDGWSEFATREHVIVQLSNGAVLPFPRWIAKYSAHARWENHFTPEMLALSPDLAIDFVLNDPSCDVAKAGAVLRALKEVTSYNAGLLEYMLSKPSLAALIPDVFANAFETFPVEQLHWCIDSPNINQETLLFRLASTVNPLHRLVHTELIRRVLNSPVNLHHDRYVASMLRGHTAEDTASLLRNAQEMGSDNWLWLVREVEAARGERLINEDGDLRRQQATVE